MIVEFLMQAAAGFAGWLMDLFPKFEPNQIANASGQVQNLAAIAGTMSNWVNWAAMASQVLFVLGGYFTFLALRIVRVLIGHLPLIGGNG